LTRISQANRTVLSSGGRARTACAPRLCVLDESPGGRRSFVSGRRNHPTHVFSYNGHPVSRMHTHTWMRACERAGLPGLRVHDLKHTFGRRLRAAGVSFEDRQDLLGHKSTRITTHYSRSELVNLIAAANRVCEEESRTGDPEKQIPPCHGWLIRRDRWCSLVPRAGIEPATQGFSDRPRTLDTNYIS